jgi:hypothetical protein
LNGPEPDFRQVFDVIEGAPAMSETDKKQEDVEVVEFLKQEAASERRGAKITWIVGLIIVAIAWAYMHTILVATQTALEPMTAARMIGMHVEAGLPSALDGTEEALKQQSAPLANALSDKIMETIPLLREEGEKQIDMTYKSRLPCLREEIRGVVKCYVDEHEKEFALVYQTQKEAGFAEVFIDTVTAEAVRSLNEHLKREHGERDLKYAHSVSLQALEDINSELVRLLNLNTDQMSRNDRLQRRLIVTWMHVLDEILHKRSVGEVPDIY